MSWILSPIINYIDQVLTHYEQENLESRILKALKRKALKISEINNSLNQAQMNRYGYNRSNYGYYEAFWDRSSKKQLTTLISTVVLSTIDADAYRSQLEYKKVDVVEAVSKSIFSEIRNSIEGNVFIGLSIGDIESAAEILKVRLKLIEGNEASLEKITKQVKKNLQKKRLSKVFKTVHSNN